MLSNEKPRPAGNSGRYRVTEISQSAMVAPRRDLVADHPPADATASGETARRRCGCALARSVTGRRGDTDVADTGECPRHVVATQCYRTRWCRRRGPVTRWFTRPSRTTDERGERTRPHDTAVLRITTTTTTTIAHAHRHTRRAPHTASDGRNDGARPARDTTHDKGSTRSRATTARATAVGGASGGTGPGGGDGGVAVSPLLICGVTPR